MRQPVATARRPRPAASSKAVRGLAGHEVAADPIQAPATAIKFTAMAAHPCTEFDVLMGYQVFLGRTPESRAVIDEAQCSLVNAFIPGLLRSIEFNQAVSMPLGRQARLRHERTSANLPPECRDWLMKYVAVPAAARKLLYQAQSWTEFWEILIKSPGFPAAGPQPAISNARLAPPGAIDLLGPGPIDRIRIDLTTRCNLRCVYCAVSQLNYQGQDMAPELAARARKIILQLTAHHTLAAVDINGHGETTMLAGWVDFCRSLLRHDVPLRLTSNFAKEFDDSELDVLARMKTIAISIDTSDRLLLRRLRRKVDVRQIVMNVHRVRMKAREISQPPPYFSLLAGLYDQNTLNIADFARFAIGLDIRHVSFWNLTEYPYENTDVAAPDRVRSLDSLPDDELKPRILAIRHAISLLRKAGVAVNVHAGFLQSLARRVGVHD
jgi:Radical SAM superfamily